MHTRVLKYFTPISLYILCWFSFTGTGIITWAPNILAWIILPLIELALPPDPRNMEDAEKEMAKKNKLYDYLLYSIVILQYAALIYFIFSFRNARLEYWEIAGRILSMGLLCGTFGINVAHELGHRVNRREQFLAKALLATSLYIHFFIEHNKGHHKHVATPGDPSSARLNEPVYTFYFRTIIFSYLSAWKIANAEMRKQGRPVIHIKNEMIQAHIIHLLLMAFVYFLGGMTVFLYFLAAAFIGIILLETVNYIEHYGLQRQRIAEGKYERAMPWHSWNSNHIMGRLMLFELSRHSDHHYMASKKYQVLEHHDDAPQLPTGYPGSMILALVPPLWFYIMNKKIKSLYASMNGAPK